MANTRSKAPASKAKAAATPSPASKTQGKNSKSTDSPSAKGRGRPRKTIDPQAEASPVAKKGRGRPRKEESVKATQPEANKQEKTEQKTNQTSVEKIVNNEQISKAIGEIISYVSRESNKPSSESSKKDLFEDADEQDDEISKNLFVNISTKKLNSKFTLKPKAIRLSHQFRDVSKLRTCIIVKDQLITSNETLESIENLNLPTLQKIYTIQDIKTEFKNFEKRRQLHNDYDLFLVDDNVFNILPNALGKTFFKSNKAPVPIKITKNKELSLESLKNQLAKAVSSTFYIPPISNNIVIKAGGINNLNQDQLVDNVQDIIATFNQNDIRAIFVKTTLSPALPIFYADKIYDQQDILNEDQEKIEDEDLDDDAYKQGLLELADADTVAKLLGSELKKKKSSPKAKAAKKAKNL